MATAAVVRSTPRSLAHRLTTPKVMGWGVLLGLLAAYSTDLFLTYVGG